MFSAKNWEVTDVSAWLKSLNLNDYADQFRRNDIRGKELLRLETADIKVATKDDHVVASLKMNAFENFASKYLRFVLLVVTFI